MLVLAISGLFHRLSVKRFKQRRTRKYPAPPDLDSWQIANTRMLFDGCRGTHQRQRQCINANEFIKQ